MRVSGWGLVKPDDLRSTANILMAVDVTVFPDKECKKIHVDPFTKKTKITNRMLCAGDKQGNKDSCQGESGGIKFQARWHIKYL